MGGLPQRRTRYRLARRPRAAAHAPSRLTRALGSVFCVALARRHSADWPTLAKFRCPAAKGSNPAEVAPHFPVGPARTHQPRRRMVRGAEEQMPDFVRDGTADKSSRVRARPARYGHDSIGVHRGERAGPLLDIDDRVSERAGRGNLRSGDDSHEDLVRSQRVGATCLAIAPHELQARVSQNRARRVASDRRLGCQSDVVVSPDHQPLRLGTRALAAIRQCGVDTRTPRTPIGLHLVSLCPSC